MSHAYRVLRITFETREDLDREYETNLVNGGLFIPGRFELLYGEAVLVLVDLPFAATAVDLEGRVVQSIPVEFEENGGRCGVAIELSSPAQEIRAILENAISDRFETERSRGNGNRHAARSVAHARARVRVPGANEVEGQTRNLSLAGVLIAILDEAPPVGQEVVVAIVHPTTGDERSIPGRVARHDLDDRGQVRGIGVQFNIDPACADETIHYLNQVKASEHARRIGGITGSIDTLGLNDLLMSFGQCVPRGRFTLMRAGEVGLIHVERGLLMSAQIGAATGVKALVRMAEWEDGNFEFHANLAAQDRNDGEPMSIPIEAAILEAARLIDESRGVREIGLPLEAGLRLEPRALDQAAPDLSKLETRILDLVRVGMTVARLLDSIQEPDGLIEQSVLALVERNVLQLETGASAA